MSEARDPYLVSGLSEGPNPRSLLLFTDPNYVPPTSADVRSIIKGTGATGKLIAGLTGVDPRTVRKWQAPPDASNHAPCPYSAWRMILIAAGKVSPPALLVC